MLCAIEGDFRSGTILRDYQTSEMNHSKTIRNSCGHAEAFVAYDLSNTCTKFHSTSCCSFFKKFRNVKISLISAWDYGYAKSFISHSSIPNEPIFNKNVPL